MIVDSGDMRIRMMYFLKSGDVIAGHGHNFPHTTFCTKGGLTLEELSGGEVVAVHTIRAGQPFNWHLVPAGVKHRITALAPIPEMTEAMLIAARKAAPGIDDATIKNIIEASQSIDTGTHSACLYPFRNSEGEIVPEYDSGNPIDPYR